MCGNHQEISLGFTGKKVAAGAHLCMIFEDDAERRRIIGKFLCSGLLDGEQVAYFADVMTKDEVVAWLNDMQIDVATETSAQNLAVQDTLSAYCPSGAFVVEDMLERLKAFYTDAVEHGYRQARVSGEMSWALKGIPGSERLMEYEAWVNIVLQTHPLSAICQYDAHRFSGALIMDALRVHPMMIVRGQIVHNPYYLPPQEFLQEFASRIPIAARSPMP